MNNEFFVGGGTVESWIVVSGEDIGGMELDGGDSGYVPEDDAHTVMLNSSGAVDEKPNVKEEKDCKCDYQEEEEEEGGEEKEEDEEGKEKKDENLVPEASSQPLFLSWSVWQRLRYIV